jgi:hypothetical protein
MMGRRESPESPAPHVWAPRDNADLEWKVRNDVDRTPPRVPHAAWRQGTNVTHCPNMCRNSLSGDANA